MIISFMIAQNCKDLCLYDVLLNEHSFEGVKG